MNSSIARVWDHIGSRWSSLQIVKGASADEPSAPSDSNHPVLGRKPSDPECWSSNPCPGAPSHQMSDDFTLLLKGLVSSLSTQIRQNPYVTPWTMAQTIKLFYVRSPKWP